MNILQLISEHWNLLWLVVTVLTGFVLWHMSQRFVSKKDFDSVIGGIAQFQKNQETALAELNTGIIQLNATINNMPNTAALHRLELGLEELRGLQKETAAQIKGQSAAMDRLNDNFDRLAIKREAL